MERLPLSCVRTFAVVARLLSISRAAEELSVTPSAVSHQIKLLEQYLSVSLFHREKNRIRLTPVGQQYLSEVSEGLMLLGRATHAIKATEGQQVLRIGAPPTLAVLWLVDKLGRFMKSHPDIPLSLTTVPDPTAMLQRSFDVGFWYGSGTLPGLTIHALCDNRVFPICKPSFVMGEKGLRTPADLANCTLLDSSDEAYHDYKEQRQPSWHAWLHAAGLNDVTGRRCLAFTPRLLMHRAVVAGLGVGLGRSLITVDALAAKEITIPFGPLVPFARTYNLVFPTHLAKRKDVMFFRDWILEEAAMTNRKLQKLMKRFSVW